MTWTSRAPGARPRRRHWIAGEQRVAVLTRANPGHQTASLMRRTAVLLAVLACITLDAQQRGPVVDYHQHLFGPATMARSPGLSMVTARDLVSMLDDAGIQRAAVFSIAYQYGNPNNPPVEDEYVKVMAENDWTGREVAQFPIGFEPSAA